MKRKKVNAMAVFLLLFFGGLQAQQSVQLAAGGDGSGSGGTVSYTIGHPIYTTITGTSGEVAQGVQHAFEILIVTGTEETQISLELSVFPNPTTSLLYLKIGDYHFQELSYQLLDSKGRLLQRNQLNQSTTSIAMDQLPAATYYLQVWTPEKPLKSFQIIKH